MTGLFSSRREEPTTAEPRRYARVVLERGIEGPAADDGLTYELAGDAFTGLEIGERVEAPLRGATKRGGNAARSVVGGIVVAIGGEELLDGLDAERVKPLAGRTGARLDAGLLDLGRWLARYYVCPLGMVFQTMMPAAVKHGVGARDETVLNRGEALTSETREARDRQLSPSLRALAARVEALEPAHFPLTPRALADRLEERTLRGVNRLRAAGVLVEQTRRVVRTRNEPEFFAPDPNHAKPRLTADQTHAVTGIGAELQRFGVHVLRGVTGSGKTEVYLRLIEAMLEREVGAGAIVLVPEIALTPQTARRFAARFATAGVAVLHSGLSAAKRHEQWAAVAAGRVRVVVGARSAVFAPIPKLGLIVVDEEHESSYKQEQLPRYHARDVAIKRAQTAGCPVVLGSATPSLESWASALNGRYKRWELPQRVGGGVLPRVEIVDLGREQWATAQPAAGASRPRPRFIGARLATELARTLTAGQQAILLLNKRGYASVVACADRACGWTMPCDQCSVALVLHKEGRVPAGSVVKCHHCLSAQTVPRRCPNCAGALTTLGPGTQRIEEELEERFGPAVLGERGLKSGGTLLRLDSDTMTRATDYFGALDRFARGEVRVLIGTQMIAKGLDFPNVRLVGVVNADLGLALPDFRAGERTFQLITQVAGRAGRSDVTGATALVVVQTYSPQAEAIRAASRHDFVQFAAQELRVRQEAGLPPVRRMARIVCRDEDRGKAERRCGDLAEYFARMGSDLEVLGPAEAPLARIAGAWRFSVELLADTAGRVQAALNAARAQGLLKSDAHTAVDVDPVMLL